MSVVEFIKNIFVDDPEFGNLHIKYLQNPQKRNNEHLKKYYANIELKINKLLDNTSIVTDQPNNLKLDIPDYKLVTNNFIYPYQNKEFSYLTGPILVYYYKTGTVIDIKRYIREHFNNELLKRYLFDETVECSKQLLERLLPGSKVFCYGSRDLDRYLDKYGVAIVSQFKIYDDYKDTHITQYNGKPQGKSYEQTSMAMIGYKIADDKKYYLLQTSWICKPFIEVDEEYLIRSSATVYFVKNVENEKGSLPKATGTYLNLEELDKPDGYFNEM